MAARIFLLVTIFLFSVLPSASALDSRYLDINDLVAEALRSNPELRARRLQAAAARTRIRQAEAWNPPQIGVEFFQTPIRSFPEPYKDSMEIDYFIQQMFPFPGKLSAMGRSALKSTAMAEQDIRGMEKKIILDVKSGYYALYFVERKIQNNTDNQDLSREFAEIAKSLYEVGIGRQTDIFRAQTALSLLKTEGINLLQEKKTAEARINSLLNRPVRQSLAAGVPEIADDPTAFSFDALAELAVENRPELRAIKDNIAMYASELALARREFYPDIMLRLMYKDMDGTSDDFWSTMIGMEVPLAFWSADKYRGRADENDLNMQKSTADYLGMETRVKFEIQDALASMETSRNLMVLYRHTLIPQAQASLQSAKAAYQTGDADFLSLIDAGRMLIDSRLNYHQSVMNLKTSEAALEYAVGLSMEEITARLK